MRRADREIKSILQSNAVEMHDDTVKGSIWYWTTCRKKK